MIRFRRWDIEVSGRWAEEIGCLIILLMVLVPTAGIVVLFHILGWAP